MVEMNQENIRLLHELPFDGCNRKELGSGLETAFELFRLKQAGFVELFTFPCDNERYVRLSEMGKKNTKAPSNSEDKIVAKWKKESAEKKQLLHTYLEKAGYEVEEKNDDLICRRNFSRYILRIPKSLVNGDISSTANSHFFDDCARESKSILFFIFTLEDKIAYQKLMRQWILNSYKGYGNFLEDDMAYSIFSWKDIESTLNFPMNIPKDGNLYRVIRKSFSESLANVQTGQTLAHLLRGREDEGR